MMLILIQPEEGNCVLFLMPTECSHLKRTLTLAGDNIRARSERWHDDGR